MIQVIRADDEDVKVLGQVIADAFFDLPQSQWLIADPCGRRTILPGYFRLVVEHALANGVVHTTTDRSGEALWIPGGERAGELTDEYLDRLADVTGMWVKRFAAFEETLDQHHPAGFAHHYLAILAVRPDEQGKGIGTALLNAYHQQLDQAGITAYLEAADERTSRLYQRHRYTLLPSAPFCLPEEGPWMWPMVRRPLPWRER